jgi:uncharacterized protein
MRSESSRRFLELGCDDYERGDFGSAIRNFEFAAKRGSPEAQVNLGNMLDAGEGTEPNVRRAIHWYKLAVRHGLPQAAWCLAITYRDRGAPRWANYWLRRACAMGDVDAAEAVAAGGW